MIEIDGSYLEAGGQIVRTAVALSAVTGKPCRIFNIRKGRPKPGLKAQHLEGINALAKLCDAKVRGNTLGSEEIEFNPGKIKGGKYKIDIGTAGSITLILQTLIPAAICADKEVELEIIGGTNVAWSPSINYFQHIFCNYLENFGMKRKEDFNLEIIKYGFYPKGGGKIKFTIKPFRNLEKINLIERGRFKKFDIWSIASEELRKAGVAERQMEGAKKVLRDNIKKNEIIYSKTLSTGSSIHLHAHFENCKLGADSLGERGKPAEKVGEECAILLKKQIESRACLDRWMADQILPYMALAGKGKVSVAEITNHCLTNAWIIERFLPVKFNNNKEERTIEVEPLF